MQIHFKYIIYFDQKGLLYNTNERTNKSESKKKTSISLTTISLCLRSSFKNISLCLRSSLKNISLCLMKDFGSDLENPDHENEETDGVDPHDSAVSVGER